MMESFFVVADDIQMMSEGKMLAVGLYPDRTMLVRPHAAIEPGQTVVLGKLTLLLTIVGLPAGAHLATPHMTFPDGKVAPDIRPIAVNALKDNTSNLVFAFSPFPVPQLGNYRLTVEIGGETISNEFTIKLMPGFVMPPLLPANQANKRTAPKKKRQPESISKQLAPTTRRLTQKQSPARKK